MKTTKEKIQTIRGATKVITLPYSAPDFARDAAIKYMAALRPEVVTSILDDLDTLESEVIRLEKDRRFAHDLGIQTQRKVESLEIRLAAAEELLGRAENYVEWSKRTQESVSKAETTDEDTWLSDLAKYREGK